MIYDVAIIGAGVTGGLTAAALAKYKLGVCIVEAGADVALGATKANSAIVHGGYDPVPGTLKAELNVKGAAMMADLCRRLDVHYINNGSWSLPLTRNNSSTSKCSVKEERQTACRDFPL